MTINLKIEIIKIFTFEFREWDYDKSDNITPL